MRSPYIRIVSERNSLGGTSEYFVLICRKCRKRAQYWGYSLLEDDTDLYLFLDDFCRMCHLAFIPEDYHPYLISLYTLGGPAAIKAISNKVIRLSI